jgi:hypothetical protein
MIQATTILTRRSLRRSDLEYGTRREPLTPGLDRYRLRQDENRLPLLQYPWLEHVPGADTDREEQG